MCVNCKILSGKVVAESILQSVKESVANIKGRPPCVAFLRVGDDGASVSYVRQKSEKAAWVGIKSILKVFDAKTTTERQLSTSVLTRPLTVFMSAISWHFA